MNRVVSWLNNPVLVAIVVGLFILSVVKRFSSR